MTFEFDPDGFDKDEASYRLYLSAMFDRVYRELFPALSNDETMPWWINKKTSNVLE